MADLTLEVWSDILCPWCFIGSRHLASALEATAHDVDVIWRAFQLDPNLGTEGTNNRRRLVDKFGGEAHYEAAAARVSETGERVGIDFDHTGVIAANSMRAHQLVAIAAEAGRADHVVARLFSAQFEQGRNVADLGTLHSIATESGLPDPDRSVDRVAAGDCLGSVKDDIDEAGRLGIHGVPTFVADRKVGVSGAVPPEVLAGLFDQAIGDPPTG